MKTRTRARGIPWLIAPLSSLALLLAGCASSGGDDNGDGGDEPADETAGEAEAEDAGSEPDAVAEEDAGSEPEAELAEEVEVTPSGCDPEPAAGTLWALSAPDRDTGEDVRLCNYRGGVVLIVNTAAS